MDLEMDPEMVLLETEMREPGDAVHLQIVAMKKKL